MVIYIVDVDGIRAVKPEDEPESLVTERRYHPSSVMNCNPPRVK